MLTQSPKSVPLAPFMKSPSAPADSAAEKPTTGLTFAAHFATPGVSPFDEIEWDHSTAEITDDSGKAMFCQENVEVPKVWSELATKIAVSKYFYGDASIGKDPHHGGREQSVRQLIHRVTRTIADWGLEDGYFADAASAENFYQDLTWLCLHQHGAFNSPVWFNVGLYHQYGVGKHGEEGSWFWDETQGKARRAPGQYHYPQASACFIQGATTGADWWRLRVGDGEPCEKKNTRELLRKIALGTWTCGDPSMQFDSTIHHWHTCKGSGRPSQPPADRHPHVGHLQIRNRRPQRLPHRRRLHPVRNQSRLQLRSAAHFRRIIYSSLGFPP